MKILICGHRSFVATGLDKLLSKSDIDYDCFSRGIEARNSNIVTGNVFEMKSNELLTNYDTVINFIFLKGQSIDDNLKYIKSLLSFCNSRQVKRLIQISSISAYSNEAIEINEESDIESNYHNKGGYASIKVAVDHYLRDHPLKETKITYVRPGFIYDKNHEISKVGLLISKFGFNILLGDKRTTLPLISKENIHEALLKMVKKERLKDVYLLLNKNKEIGTKYRFVNEQWNVKPICLPHGFIMSIAKLLKTLHLLKEKQYLKVVGLFKQTHFDSSASEKDLNISFDRKKIAIIGAGAYGSYISNLLSIKYPHETIDLYDVGNKQLKNENEMGFLSHIINAPYKGVQKARFFGYGGTSVKWGGQLLTFGDYDFQNPSTYLKEIVEINKKYKEQVLARFGLINKSIDEKLINGMFTRTGIWLNYFNRNLFKKFKIASNHKINIFPNARIVKIYEENGKIMKFDFIENTKFKTANYDQYFLTSGAFESSRILINSGLSPKIGEMTFSDHLSQRAFKITSGPKIGFQNYTFKIQHFSLVTKRIIGEINGYSFYSQPIYNEKFPFFQDLKKLLFGHHVSINLLWDIIKNIPNCFLFAWDILILKKLYIYRNEYYLQIDIEAPRGSGLLTLNKEPDKFGEKSINVDFSIINETGDLFTKARDLVKKYLDNNNVKYSELPFSTSAEKYEDVYHPFGMFCDFKDVNDYFKHFKNMLVVNTGILPRAGGINSTCAVLPLVEEYINNIMK